LPPEIISLPLSSCFARKSFGNIGDCQSGPAEVVVDELLLRDRLLGEWELKEIRQAGASNQELILATVISTKTGKPARSVYQEVKSGPATWGGLLQSAVIDTKNMLKEISGLCSRH